MTKNTHKFYYEKTDTIIEYLDLERIKEIHPDGEFTISGEIILNSNKDVIRKKQIRGSKKEIYVEPLGTYKESCYKTVGYVPCESGEYILFKKKTYKKRIIYVLLGMIILLITFGGYLLINHKNKLGIDPNSKAFTSSLKRPKNIDNSKILIPGYGKFELKKGSNIINTVLFNPKGNPCYFQFFIVEKATNEVLYESKLVPPNKGITPVKLNKKFHKVGTYNLVLKFRTYDLENTSIHYNGSNTDIMLNVVE